MPSPRPANEKPKGAEAKNRSASPVDQLRLMHPCTMHQRLADKLRAAKQRNAFLYAQKEVENHETQLGPPLTKVATLRADLIL